MTLVSYSESESIMNGNPLSSDSKSFVNSLLSIFSDDSLPKDKLYVDHNGLSIFNFRYFHTVIEE